MNVALADQGTFLGEVQRGWARFWRLSWWWKAASFAFVGIVILFIVGAAVGGDDDESDSQVQAAATASPTDAVEATEAAKPTHEPSTLVPTQPPTVRPTEPPPTSPPAPAITYQIAAREDVSFGVCIRIVYRVSVSGPLTDAELRRIAQEVIDDETGQQEVNAIGFFFYLPGTDTTSVYTAGVADWAPNGIWGTACDIETGDYSSHELGAIDLGGP